MDACSFRCRLLPSVLNFAPHELIEGADNSLIAGPKGLQNKERK